jgi:hypothetical protein
MAIVSKEVAVDVDIEFDVSCNVCGHSLNTTTNRYNELIVDPCEFCLQTEYEKRLRETQNN